MLLVDSEIRYSKQQRLYTKEFIARGQIVVVQDDNIDREYSTEELFDLHPVITGLLKKFGWLDKMDYWHLDGSNGRYMRKSSAANIIFDTRTKCGYAIADIETGDELTIRYDFGGEE
jgi:hypothetical protein